VLETETSPESSEHEQLVQEASGPPINTGDNGLVVDAVSSCEYYEQETVVDECEAQEPDVAESTEEVVEEEVIENDTSVLLLDDYRYRSNIAGYILKTLLIKGIFRSRSPLHFRSVLWIRNYFFYPDLDPAPTFLRVLDPDPDPA
jgi:hypothetical protein